MTLPAAGDLDWATPLNDVITADESSISEVTGDLAAHEANSPADPHGDRAYAAALVSPITTGTNEANGYVIADGNGKIPLALVPVGAGLTSFIDAIPDYSVPTNGTDGSTQLNDAIYQTYENGGGIVWVGAGTIGLAAPIIMYPNVWLWCSPGTIFNRILTVSAPKAMCCNYSSTISPSGGFMRITGGQWNVANIGYTGTCFSFANASNILIEDCIVTVYPDGKSPCCAHYGCSNITHDNIYISGDEPITSGRASQTFPLFQLEELNSTNLPSIPSEIYANQECSNIMVRTCSLNASTLSDSYGDYSAWSSFAGSIGTITSGNSHNNINIVQGCYASALAVSGIQSLNWINVTCSGNNFSYPQSAYDQAWEGVEPEQFLFDVNSPASYAPSTTATCHDTVTETIICQFAIPANDWLEGTTCYRHHHSGLLSTGSTARTVTFRVYVGPLGTKSDTQLSGTLGAITLDLSLSSVPYSVNHKGFDIDAEGYWNSCGWEFVSAAGTYTIVNGSARFQATRGEIIYITITVEWSSADTACYVVPSGGCTERINL